MGSRIPLVMDGRKEGKEEGGKWGRKGQMRQEGRHDTR